MSLKLAANAGGFEVTVEACFVGEDLLIICAGGDRPHIGAVAVAVFTGTGREPQVELIRVANHREDELSAAAALKISTTLECTVTFIAGMHWDTISKAGIAQVLANVESLVDQLIDRLPGQAKERP
ncbi:MAG: hypothetical protein C0623_05010 [Desulfuromonas sp.]|nr:MAG: hypothetical protein C0623_05010 [Desulfuromonas sp.]